MIVSETQEMIRKSTIQAIFGRLSPIKKTPVDWKKEKSIKRNMEPAFYYGIKCKIVITYGRKGSALGKQYENQK